MNENPAYDWYCDSGGETAGKEPSGAGHIQTCRNKSNHIHGNEQNGANKRNNLFRGHFFHLKTSFLHALSVHMNPLLGIIHRVNHSDISYFITVSLGGQWNKLFLVKFVEFLKVLLI